MVHLERLIFGVGIDIGIGISFVFSAFFHTLGTPPKEKNSRNTKEMPMPMQNGQFRLSATLFLPFPDTLIFEHVGHFGWHIGFIMLG